MGVGQGGFPCTVVTDTHSHKMVISPKMPEFYNVIKMLLVQIVISSERYKLSPSYFQLFIPHHVSIIFYILES